MLGTGGRTIESPESSGIKLDLIANAIMLRVSKVGVRTSSADSKTCKLRTVVVQSEDSDSAKLGQ